MKINDVIISSQQLHRQSSKAVQNGTIVNTLISTRSTSASPECHHLRGVAGMQRDATQRDPVLEGPDLGIGGLAFKLWFWGVAPPPEAKPLASST